MQEYRETYLRGSVMAGFEYRQAAEIRDALGRHNVRYLFIGKSGADKASENRRALAAALRDLG